MVLSPSLIPLHYSICLHLDPEHAAFTGRECIRMEIFRSISKILLDSKGLGIERASIVAEGEEWPVTVDASPQTVGFEVGRMLQPGIVVLRLEWKGLLQEAPEGLFRTRIADTWYVYSQFEPSGASQAFPCFDDPALRATYEISLRVPHGLVALSNALEMEEVLDGSFKTVRFKVSRPLPSCLVAFAVGLFDLRESPMGAIPGVRLRAITRCGMGEQSGGCLKRANLLVNALADWLGHKYPYEKIDLVAVPDFGPGAVENPGLLMFRERILLDSASASAFDLRKRDLIIAHELAHMWFGGLVGISSWDEIWLSESLATWIANKIVSRLYNEIETDTIIGMLEAIELDAQPGTHALRRRLEGPAQVLGAFDIITYAKGAALLRMVEQWIGEAKFRKAIRLYLEVYQGRVASSSDLIASIVREGGEEVIDVICSFLDTPGAPLLEFIKISSDTGATIRIKQRPFHGLMTDVSERACWQVPVRIRYGAGDEVRTLSIVLNSPAAEVGLGLNPDWVHPNMDEAGYYQWRLPPEDLLALVQDHRHHFSPAELLALPGRLQLLLRSRHLPLVHYLEMLKELGRDLGLALSVQRGVLNGLKCLRRLSRGLAEEPAVAGFIRSILLPHVERIGTLSSPNTLSEITRWQRDLLWTLSEEGGDEQIREQLAEKGRAFVADNFLSGQDEASYCIFSAARIGDADFLTELINCLSKEVVPAKREILVNALGSFTDPQLLWKALDLYFSPLMRSQDLSSLLRHTRCHGESLSTLIAWLDVSYERIREKVGSEEAAFLPWVVSDICDVESRDLVMRIFSKPSRWSEASDLHLCRVINQINEQIVWRDALISEIRAYFGRES
jgi:alanyl aminopeptidase